MTFSTTTATTAELVAKYNELSGKTIKKFSSRAAGEKQVEALLAKSHHTDTAAKAVKGTKTVAAPKAAKAEKVPRVKKEKVAKVPADRSESIRRSWSNKDTHDARSARHNVTVNGEEYRSVSAAFTALKLPMGQHIKFRMELKAEGKKTFEHDGQEYAFKIAAKAE